MTKFDKNSTTGSSFSVRELLNLRDDSPASAEAVFEGERSNYVENQQRNEKLELRKVKSEIGDEERKRNDDKHFSRFK